MYLKRLELQGFKSFPEKTVLFFERGITSIVGPNGCGKSNIADAIRWVLGEQSMKSIRGNKLEDVIFSGTEFRKSIGFAEVSLTLDNSDKVLPLEFSEITVTRRVFRSGESEYFINKTPCRLKDINNLFLDTGVGRDGYSIIGQGKIDEILSAKSEDRRSIFEEASGIMKYRVKKEEAEKKLELTKQNILRIDDIIGELEAQLEPLREQSETARQYLVLRDQLKELEISVYVDIIARHKEKIRKSEDDYKSVFDNKNMLVGKIEMLSNENAAKSLLLKNIEENLDAFKKEYYNLHASCEKCIGEKNLNNEKINNIKKNMEKTSGEIILLEQKYADIQTGIRNNERALEELSLKHDKILCFLAEKEKSLGELANTLNEFESILDATNKELMEKLDLLSDKKLQVGNIKTHMENMQARKNSINNEIGKSIRDMEQEQARKAALHEKISNLAKEMEDLRASLDSLIEQKRKLDKDLEAGKERRDLLKSEIRVKASRYKLLKEMEDKLEGYDNAVKLFINACKNEPSAWKGIRGILGQLISVDEKYETAVEIALGGAIQNIVADTEEDAKAAIEFLKKRNFGRATFLPITSVKGKHLEPAIITEAGKVKGYLGIISDVVKCEREYKGIVDGLLGKTVLVETLDPGIVLAKKSKYAFRIVTLDGDIIYTSGAMTGGSRGRNYHGLLGRTREISALNEDIVDYEANLSLLEDNIKSMTASLDNTMKKIQSAQAGLKEKEMEKLRHESQFSHLDENIKNMNAKAEMLKGEYAQILKQEEELSQELLKYEDEQKRKENEISRLKEIINERQESQKKNLSEREALAEEIAGLKIALNSKKENIDTVKRSMQGLVEQSMEIQREISGKKLDMEESEKRIKLIGEQNLELENKIKAYNEQRTGKNIEIDRAVEEKRAIEEELTENASLLEDCRKNIALLNEELNRISIRKVKEESELDVVQNKLWDDYGLTYGNALELRKDTGSMAKAQKEINEYKNRIRELGHVNINAIEEYAKTKERYDFLAAQKEDMEDSVEKLKKVIYEINARMKEQFMDKFNLINKNFNMVFKDLFGGGMANLRLVDNENVLESAIEIESQPPGKRLQNMMLLSGGERAFTAIALLFSILLLKPVSFSVLDEIEATLDEANVNRFAAYIKKLSGRTQFIIITHKKNTMEASDSIYGVTMQEKGVSKVVSMKIKEAGGGIKAG